MCGGIRFAAEPSESKSGSNPGRRGTTTVIAAASALLSVRGVARVQLLVSGVTNAVPGEVVQQRNGRSGVASAHAARQRCW